MKWEVDPPSAVFNGVLAGHYKSIKAMRGVPGVRAERFEEAMTVKHAALSLVGEVGSPTQPNRAWFAGH